MPTMPLRACASPACAGRARRSNRFCDYHQAEHDAAARRVERAYRRSKGPSLYDHRWRKARLAYLTRNPLCVRCQSEGRITSASVVDHIIPHKQNLTSFWSVDNWQSLCKPCHDTKTATEDGAFGNVSKPRRGEPRQPQTHERTTADDNAEPEQE